MMTKRTLLVLTFILGMNLVFSQKLELGKVTVEELKEKFNSKDSSAVATILFEKGVTFFEYSQENGFFITTDVEVRIKIYKKEGYDWANKEISYYTGGSSNESVSFSKAVTYNLVNGEIEKSKLKSDGEFVEKENKLWSTRKITMPNVKEGSVIEYKYSIRSPFLSNFPEWHFQNEIPVNYSEYATYIPEYYTYSVYRKGSLAPKEEKNMVSRSITLNYKEAPTRAQNGGYTHSSESFNYSENQIKYVLENVPALKEEQFVSNINNYTSSIQHELSRIQMPQTTAKTFSETWEDVARKIYESEDFGDQLNKTNYYEDEVKILLQGITDDNEKMNVVFNFVKSRMNWNKFKGIFCSDGVKKAYQDKTGNTAEINLMLVSMLRYAGLDANPVLISTRANGIAIYPSRTAFNHVLASVRKGEELILLDAINKNALPNVLPIQDLNWLGRLIKKDGISEMIDLMPKQTSSDVVNILANIDAEGTVSGQIREQYFDYYALEFREKNSLLAQDNYLEKLEKRFKGLEIENYERLNDKELAEPVVEKYSFKNNNAVEIIGNKMYFSPMLYLAMRENYFKQETREYPIDFNFPTNDKYAISLTIPDGYQVESIPTQINFGMVENYGSFKYIVSASENKIQLVVTLVLNSAIVPSDYYEVLKEFFKKVVEKENEKIVLLKK